MISHKNLSLWLPAALILSMLVSLYSVRARYNAEVANQTTALAVEYEVVEALAAAQGVTTEKALTDLKAQGVTSVVLSEGYLGDLVTSGRATLVSVSTGPGVPLSSGLTLTDVRQLPRVQTGLRIRFKDLAGDLVPRVNTIALPPVAPLVLRQTPIGLDPDQVALAKRLKLEIIGRCSNPSGVSSSGVQDTLKWLKANGADVFLPMGDQVLGRRDSLLTTVKTLADLGIRYATPEFAKIGGDQEVVAANPGNVIRLHTAQVAELDKLDFDGAVDRFVKAARERNMRILMIRPFSASADQPVGDFAQFIKKIYDELKSRGIPVGHPHTYSDPGVRHPVYLLLGVLVAAVSFCVALEMFSDRRILVGIAVLLGLLLLAWIARAGLHPIRVLPDGTSVDRSDIFRQAFALLASGAFPLAGFLFLDRLRTQKSLPTELQPLPGFVLVSAISILGGLCVAGLLNGLPYIVKAEEFRGIKVSIFLPILLVGCVFASRLLDRGKVLKSPVTWGTLILGAVIIGVLAFMLERTGNDSTVAASGGELEVRGFLDNVLFVRPRTKEFLVGHPALYLAIGLLAFLKERPADREKLAAWTVLALMVGSIGQTSVVNTLCHLHIPLALSLARIFIGLGLGCIIGIGIWAIASRLLSRGNT